MGRWIRVQRRAQQILVSKSPFMQRIFRFYPLSIIVIALVTVACLIPINDPPLGDVPFMDKWTHMALFGGICSVLVFEMVVNRKPNNADLPQHPKDSNCLQRSSYNIWLAPILASLYGGAIELMQANLTTCRSGEWMDFVADAFGAFALFPPALFVSRKITAP